MSAGRIAFNCVANGSDEMLFIKCVATPGRLKLTSAWRKSGGVSNIVIREVRTSQIGRTFVVVPAKCP